MNRSSILPQNFWTFLKEYLLITLGVLFYTGGWTFFLMPKNLVGGGVTGIGVILEYATGFPVSYTYFILNVLLLIASFFIASSAGMNGSVQISFPARGMATDTSISFGISIPAANGTPFFCSSR